MLDIRQARAADIPALCELDPLARGVERRQFITDAVVAESCQIAIAGGTIAGYVVVNASFFHRTFIELVVVAEGYRRRGIGTALIATCLALTPDEAVWTSTNESNTPMRALLTGLGFVASGRIDNLDPGDPELIFVHPLKVTPIEAAAR